MLDKIPAASIRYVHRLALAGLIIALAGCSAFRLYDAGRLKVATEANAVATELSSNAGAVFGPMEANLDAVREAQKTLRDLSNKHRFETYQAIVARKTADELGEDLLAALGERVDTIEAVDQHVRAAANAVNEALDREKSIAAASGEQINDRSSLQEALTRAKKRLDWLATVVDNIGKLDDLGGKAGLATSLPDLSKGTAELSSLTTKAKEALGNVESDKRVDAATKLLKQAAGDIASSEQARVLEMKRHLAEIARLRDAFETRDGISICKVLIFTFGELYPALGDTQRKSFEELVGKLAERKNGSNPRYPCLATDWKPSDERARQVKGDWNGKTIADFLAADISKRREKATAPVLVSALGVLMFHEREYFETVRWDLAREEHRHSVRISRSNAQERAQLVSYLSQALEVYHQGGIKPEAVAQLILLAAQVGALTFIGAQQ